MNNQWEDITVTVSKEKLNLQNELVGNMNTFPTGPLPNVQDMERLYEKRLLPPGLYPPITHLMHRPSNNNQEYGFNRDDFAKEHGYTLGVSSIKF